LSSNIPLSYGFISAAKPPTVYWVISDLFLVFTPMKSWKQISNQLIYSSPYVTVSEDQIELPSGMKSSWLRIEAPTDGVCVICFDDQGRILIVDQYCHPPAAMVLELPGGKIDPGESPTEAAAREVREETGAVLGNVQILGKFLLNNRRSSRYCYVATAKVSGMVERSMEPHEDGEVYWMTSDELETLVREGKVMNQNLLAAWAIYLQCRPKDQS
jgi:ADP-ribose pyrophosphatase